MNALEAQLHYPFGDTLPASGSTLEVAAGVRWVRMALPFALDHINLWLLRDQVDGRDGWSVVDCCVSKPGRSGRPFSLRNSTACPSCGSS